MPGVDVNDIVAKLRERIGTLAYDLAVAEAVADVWRKEAQRLSEVLAVYEASSAADKN